MREELRRIVEARSAQVDPLEKEGARERMNLRDVFRAWRAANTRVVAADSRVRAIDRRITELRHELDEAASDADQARINHELKWAEVHRRSAASELDKALWRAAEYWEPAWVRVKAGNGQYEHYEQHKYQPS